MPLPRVTEPADSHLEVTDEEELPLLLTQKATGLSVNHPLYFGGEKVYKLDSRKITCLRQSFLDVHLESGSFCELALRDGHLLGDLLSAEKFKHLGDVRIDTEPVCRLCPLSRLQHQTRADAESNREILLDG